MRWNRSYLILIQVHFESEAKFNNFPFSNELIGCPRNLLEIGKFFALWGYHFIECFRWNKNPLNETHFSSIFPFYLSWKQQKLGVYNNDSGNEEPCFSKNNTQSSAVGVYYSNIPRDRRTFTLLSQPNFSPFWNQNFRCGALSPYKNFEVGSS